MRKEEYLERRKNFNMLSGFLDLYYEKYKDALSRKSMQKFFIYDAVSKEINKVSKNFKGDLKEHLLKVSREYSEAAGRLLEQYNDYLDDIKNNGYQEYDNCSETINDSIIYHILSDVFDDAMRVYLWKV